MLLLVLPATLLSLPQQQQQQQPVAAEDDPWLAVINGNNNVDKPQQDDSEYYQFEDTQQQQQQQVLPPQQRYPDRRQDLAQPQVPQQLPPQRRYPQGPPPQAPPRGQFRGGQPQPVQRRPLPPPPVKRPQKEEPGLLDTIAQGVSNVFQPATCAATNLIADEKLKDDDFIKAQMDCAMGVKPCDDIGKQIKSKEYNYKIMNIFSIFFSSSCSRSVGWKMSCSLQSLHQEPDQEGDVSAVSEVSPGVPDHDAEAGQTRKEVNSIKYIQNNVCKQLNTQLKFIYCLLVAY